ncbi:hypothetical protein P7C70_g9079, partial [Phenoliferia sp. Uapishka_3]
VGRQPNTLSYPKSLFPLLAESDRDDAADLEALRRCWIDVALAWRDHCPSKIAPIARQFEIISSRLASRCASELASLSSPGADLDAPSLHPLDITLQRSNEEEYSCSSDSGPDGPATPRISRVSSAPTSSDGTPLPRSTTSLHSISKPTVTSTLCARTPSPDETSPSTSAEGPPHHRVSHTLAQTSQHSPLPPSTPEPDTEIESSEDEKDWFGVPRSPTEVRLRKQYMRSRLEQEGRAKRYARRGETGEHGAFAATFTIRIEEMWKVERERRLAALRADTGRKARIARMPQNLG